MRLRTRLAIFCAKASSLLIRKLNKGDGVTFPGYVAHKLDPMILQSMAGMVRKKIVVVMGTNGKTTTNSLLYHVLEAGGGRVVTNRTGANMRNGIVAAFALATDWKGTLHADYACMEVDENESVHVLKELNPHCVVVTNISRDQLDRYGEVDVVRNKLKEAISSVPDALLILNSDDVISYSLSMECGNRVVSYGISERIFDESVSSAIRDSIFCRRCGSKLAYEFFHYGQLGIWHCPDCGLARPKPDYTATDIQYEDGVYSFSLDGKTVKTTARTAYNVYNTLSAYAALGVLGATRKFASVVERFDYGNNRESIFHINGTRVQLHLAKNPVGFQQKIALVRKDADPKDIVIQINDGAQDGKDISWLWDVDFQHLADVNASAIMVGGTRRYDMLLRLKYEDIAGTVITDMRETIQKLAAEGTGNIYVIVNYTGLYRVRNMLTELQKGE